MNEVAENVIDGFCDKYMNKFDINPELARNGLKTLSAILFSQSCDNFFH